MRRVLMALALGLVLAGCGGGGSSDSTGTTVSSASKPTATDASVTTEVTSSAPSTTEGSGAPAYRLLSEDELTAAILGLGDLPAGYSQDPPVADGDNKTFCDYKPPVTAKVQVGKDFTKGGGMSAEALSFGLRQFNSPEEAKAAFDAMNDAVASCTGETYNGSELTYSPMSAPKVGDASLGVKISVDGTDLLQFFALVGPTIVNTGGGGLLNANADTVTGLLEAEVQSYQAAATR